MSNSHFCSNDLGKKPNHQYQAGLTLRNSELVSLKGSTLYNNEISQIGVIGVKGVGTCEKFPTSTCQSDPPY